MKAYPSAVQHNAEIIELAAFRRSAFQEAEQPAPVAEPVPADTVSAECVAANGTVVSLFPEFRIRPTPIVRARKGGASAAPDLVTACDLLVGNFRALQEAVLALQESCREIEADGDQAALATSGVMLGIAAVSSASETFQQELAATVDAAFR
jgi:hypothetical protein